MDNDILIHLASQEDLPTLRRIAEDMRAEKTTDYFEMGLERQSQGTSQTWIIKSGNSPAGYCLLNWEPKYSLYKKLGIPEIQDLNITPNFRRQGLAKTLMAHCETQAQQKGYSQIGISVGLHAGFGPAQCLYASLGYIPDGPGVTYDRIPVIPGDSKPIDNDLCLMMVKDLAKTAA